MRNAIGTDEQREVTLGNKLSWGSSGAEEMRRREVQTRGNCKRQSPVFLPHHEELTGHEKIDVHISRKRELYRRAMGYLKMDLTFKWGSRWEDFNFLFIIFIQLLMTPTHLRK